MSVRDAYRPIELDTVMVERGQNGRSVRCFCGQRVSRSIVPHLKADHAELWERWVETFVELRGLGYPLKRIMRLFSAGDGNLLFSWTVIERAIRQAVEIGRLPYKPPPKKGVSTWQPDSFVLETTTVWDFPRRGDWAVHSGDYRGNWPPQVARNLIERYTRKGDLVVDAFVGGGTTLIEAWLLGRRSMGLDISEMSINTAQAKLREMEELAKGDKGIILDPDCRPRVLRANALELCAVLQGVSEVDLLCVHPPYLNSIRYTADHPKDLSSLGDPVIFCERVSRFAREARSVLCKDGICAVLIGDVRKGGRIVPLGFMVLDIFVSAGFRLDSIVVKTQHKDRSSEFYMGRRCHSLLMAHEYLLVFENQLTE